MSKVSNLLFHSTILKNAIQTLINNEWMCFNFKCYNILKAVMLSQFDGVQFTYVIHVAPSVKIDETDHLKL